MIIVLTVLRKKTLSRLLCLLCYKNCLCSAALWSIERDNSIDLRLYPDYYETINNELFFTLNNIYNHELI